MSYSKLTDNDTIKAFECCMRPPKCDDCPYRIDPRNCKDVLEKSVLNLINRQKTQLVKEQNKNSKLRNERNRLQAKNEELLGKTEKLEKQLDDKCDKCIAAEKSKAYKECIKKVKSIAIKKKIVYVADASLQEQETGWLEIQEEKLDNLLKEKCNNNVQDY